MFETVPCRYIVVYCERSQGGVEYRERRSYFGRVLSLHSCRKAPVRVVVQNFEVSGLCKCVIPKSWEGVAVPVDEGANLQTSQSLWVEKSSDEAGGVLNVTKLDLQLLQIRRDGCERKTNIFHRDVSPIYLQFLQRLPA